MMNFTRSEFCKVTDIDSDRLDSLVRRKQFPAPAKSEQVEARGWKRYTFFQALQVALADELSRVSYVKVEQAFGYVSFCSEKLEGYLNCLHHADPGNQIYIVAAFTREHGKTRSGVHTMVGTLADVCSRFSEINKDVLAGQGAQGPVIMACASSCYREIKNRAASHGIELFAPPEDHELEHAG